MKELASASDQVAVLLKVLGQRNPLVAHTGLSEVVVEILRAKVDHAMDTGSDKALGSHSPTRELRPASFQT